MKIHKIRIYVHVLFQWSFLLSLPFSYAFLTAPSTDTSSHTFHKFNQLSQSIYIPSLTHISSISSSSHKNIRGIDKIRRSVFSGIVEEMGKVKSMELKEEMEMWDGSKASGYELTIKDVNVALSEGSAYDGCSIAVNGVCLTVKTFTKSLDGKKI